MIFSSDCFVKESCNKFKAGGCTENSFCQKLFRLNHLFDEAQVPENQRKHMIFRMDEQGTDREQYEKLSQIEKTIEEQVKNGLNLYICSNITGNGKTAWCFRLIQAYFNSIWYKSDLVCRALYINIPRFLLELKQNISEKSSYIEHIQKNVLTADLVIWDEVGTKAFTEFEHEHILSMINSRIDSGKANIYTSNLTPGQDLNESIGSRLYSRIINNSIIIQFNGCDKRGLFI